MPSVPALIVPAVPTMRIPDVDDDTSRWSESVRDHLETLAGAVSLDRSSLPTQELEAALTSRLVDADRIHSTDLGFGYATAFIDGVHEILTLDLPSAVVALPDARVASIGRRLPRLVDIGRGNLHRRLERTPVQVERAGEPTRRVWTITSDSPYTASFARFLADAVREWLPDLDDHNGFVFAIPHRHAIVLQSCATPRETAVALDLVPAVATAMRTEGVAPVSLDTFHWLARRVECLSVTDPDGIHVVQPTPFLQDVLDRGRPGGR
ncbi:MAG: hypothetical protein ABI187_12520 [Ornithinibacter sp.]